MAAMGLKWPTGPGKRSNLRIIIHSGYADLSADIPEDRFFKLNILLKHSRML